MRATILVRPKSGILDPQGAAVETALEHLGFASADETESRVQVEKMCEQLLANPLMESYEIELHG